MEKLFADDDLVKKSRLAICPGCDNEAFVDNEEEELECENCGSCSDLSPEGSYPEEFVWHPRRKF